MNESLQKNLFAHKMVILTVTKLHNCSQTKSWLRSLTCRLAGPPGTMIIPSSSWLRSHILQVCCRAKLSTVSFDITKTKKRHNAPRPCNKTRARERRRWRSAKRDGRGGELVLSCWRLGFKRRLDEHADWMSGRTPSGEPSRCSRPTYSPGTASRAAWTLLLESG